MSGMTEERIFELIEAYGPEPTAWPEGERDAAEALMRERSHLYKDSLEDAHLLDAALADMPEPQMPAGLAKRIIAGAPQASSPGIFARLKDTFSIGGQMWPSATAFASALFGMVIGYGALGTATQVAETDPFEEAIYAAFDSGYEATFDEASQ